MLFGSTIHSTGTTHRDCGKVDWESQFDEFEIRFQVSRNGIVGLVKGVTNLREKLDLAIVVGFQLWLCFWLLRQK